MRILIVNYLETLESGGINKAVREIAYNISLKGHEVIVFNPARSKKDEMMVTNINDNFRIVRGYRGYIYGLNLRNIGLVARIIEEFKPQIIHVHGYHSLFSTTIMMLKRVYRVRIPIVFSPHFDIERSTLAGRYLWGIYNKIIGKEIFQLADHIIVHSRYEFAAIKHFFNVDQSKITIIPHGVDIIDPRKNRKPKDTINLLYVGYLIKRKGVDHVIRALHSLIYEYNVKNVHLKIIGKGPEKNKLVKLATKLGVNGKITWIDPLPYKDLINELKNADVLLLLSSSEAYGIIVAEALALGTPVVVTRRTALIEFLGENSCFGVEYPPNPSTVAKTILDIIENYDNLKVYPVRIRGWREIAEKYLRVYFRIIMHNTDY